MPLSANGETKPTIGESSLPGRVSQASENYFPKFRTSHFLKSAAFAMRRERRHSRAAPPDFFPWRHPGADYRLTPLIVSSARINACVPLRPPPWASSATYS